MHSQVHIHQIQTLNLNKYICLTKSKVFITGITHFRNLNNVQTKEKYLTRGFQLLFPFLQLASRAWHESKRTKQSPLFLPSVLDSLVSLTPLCPTTCICIIYRKNVVGGLVPSWLEPPRGLTAEW